MTLEEIAKALAEACRSGTETQMLDELYAPTAVSVEAEDYSGEGRSCVGLDGIRGKHAWWNENFEMHSAEATGPFIHGPDKFAMIFAVDATHKPSGERTAMQEIALYTVADGKIIREEFFNPV